VRVGSVLSQRFDRKKDRIDLHIVIDEEYAGLINNKTRFWNLSGVQVNASLSGVEIKTGPLASLISGGITFDSPFDQKAVPVKNGARFDLFRGEREAMRGFAAQVKFDSAAGLQAGVTKVIYRGIEIGRVDTVDVSSDFKTVTADIGFVRDAENLLREGTQFWLVKPELSLSNISGLDALFSGAYISLKPGKGVSKVEFTALKSAPPDGSGDPGLDLILLAQESGGLSVGSPVLHKQIVVGAVQEVALSSDKKQVQVRVHIAPEFAGIVQSNTRFWQAGGVQANLGLNGLDVRSASLSSIVQGGIAFANPDGPVNRRAIVNGDQFTLYLDENAAQMDGVEIQLKTDRVDGLRVGTELRYRGVVVGQVIALSYRDQFSAAQMLLRLNRDASAFAVSGSQFFRVDGSLGLARNENVMAAISGPYIGVIPGAGETKTEFELLPREPALAPYQTGLTLQLHSDRIGGLSKGDPVLYRQVKVGEVLFGELNAKGNGVTIHILIWPEHGTLVRRGSVFWRASGLSFDAGIFDGVQVRSESLETLIAGGISFATPDEDSDDEDMKSVQKDQVFRLYEEADEDWLEWAPVLK
jgi:paraquat-inducible protein B